MYDRSRSKPGTVSVAVAAREKRPQTELVRKCHTIARQKFRRGEGFVFFYHVTHHAGTFICQKLARPNVGVRATPKFVCNLPRLSLLVQPKVILAQGWKYATAEEPFPRRDDIPFGDTSIIFLTIMRHPIARFLAEDGGISAAYPEVLKHNYSRAAYTYSADNFALRFISGAPMGLPWKLARPVTAEDLELAKRRLDLFTAVAIQEWLPESIQLFCKATGWECDIPTG